MSAPTNTLKASRPRTSTSPFNGLDEVTSADNGWLGDPPDTQLSASTNDVIEMTNSGIRLSTTAGTAVQTTDLNAFFGAPYDPGIGFDSTVFDPRIVYDAGAGTTGRFFAASLTQYNPLDPVTGVSQLHLAISRSANPATLGPSDWCPYTFDSKTFVGGPAAWSDFPSIGVGKDTVEVSTNSFEFTQAEHFRYAEVRAFDKAKAIANTVACPDINLFTWRPSPSANNFQIFNLDPATELTYPSSFKGTKNPLYLMSVEGSPLGPANPLHVWRIRNMASGHPTLSQKIVHGTWTYGGPPFAPQPYVSTTLDTGPPKVLGLDGRGNTLYGVFTSSCGVGANPPYESCVVYVRMGVGQSNSTGKMTAKLKQESGLTTGADTYIWMPSIAVNSAGQAFITAQAADESVRFGALRTIGIQIDPGASTFSNFDVTPAGECGLGTTDGERTGDYTGAVIDPSDPTKVWMAGEYAKAFVTPITGCHWGTTVAHAAP